MTVLLRAENPEVHQSKLFILPQSHLWRPTVLSTPLDPSRASSPSSSSPDDDGCSFLPFSKREYLLAQLRQKDELIDSLLKQVCLSNILNANAGAYL
jgi:hypothetical protein